MVHASTFGEPVKVGSVDMAGYAGGPPDRLSGTPGEWPGVTAPRADGY